MQGTLLKRHKVYITDPSTGSKIRGTPDCMDNGLSLNIYGGFTPLDDTRYTSARLVLQELFLALPCHFEKYRSAKQVLHLEVLMHLRDCLGCAGTVYFLTGCDAFTRAWYKDTMNREVSPTVMLPDDPLDMFRTSRRRCKATLGPPSPRTDDMARFNEARLGKPSNVLSTDSLRQFLVCSIDIAVKVHA